MQTARQSGDRVVLTFGDKSQCERAKSILESDPVGREMFTTLHPRYFLFPVIMLNVPLGEEITIREDVVKRNPELAQHLHSLRFVHRNQANGSGHIKLLFSSSKAMASCLARGFIFYDYRAYCAVEPKWDREVRRCFKCNRYGHSMVNCRAAKEACGKCAGEHVTRN